MKTISTLARSLGLAAIFLGALQAASAQHSETFNNCMENSDGSTPSNLECIYAEHKRHDKLLNDSYKTLMNRLDTESRAMLKTAQLAWIKLRDNNCQLHSKMMTGQMSTLFLEDCRLEMTAERAAELEWMTKMFSG